LATSPTEDPQDAGQVPASEEEAPAPAPGTGDGEPPDDGGPRTADELLDLVAENAESGDPERINASIADGTDFSENGAGVDDMWDKIELPTGPPHWVHWTLALMLIPLLSGIILIVLVGTGLLLARGDLQSQEAKDVLRQVVAPLLVMLGAVVAFYFRTK
jgi:hypothetical protein